MMELIGDDGLPAFVYVYVPHCLLAGLVRLHQRLQSCAGVGLSLLRQPPVALGSIEVFAHVKRRPPRQFRKHAVQRYSLGSEQSAGNGHITALSFSGESLYVANIIHQSRTFQIFANIFPANNDAQDPCLNSGSSTLRASA